MRASSEEQSVERIPGPWDRTADNPNVIPTTRLITFVYAMSPCFGGAIGTATFMTIRALREGRPEMIPQALMLGLAALVIPIAWIISYGLVGWIAIVAGAISMRLRNRRGLRWRAAVVATAAASGAAIAMVPLAVWTVRTGTMPNEWATYLSCSAVLALIAGTTATLCEWAIRELAS